VPTTWEIEGRQLRTFTASGRPLWSYPFDRAVTHPTTFSRGRGDRYDLDGDGRQELIVPLRFAASPRDLTPESDAVAAFADDGRKLWEVRPDLALTAGTERYEGPWHVYDIASGPTPDGPRTWIAFSHHTWWPSFVIEVNASGAERVRYVQGGRLYTLAYWRSQGRPLLVAGGTEREHGLASAVVIGLSDEASRWPDDGTAKVTCEGCPRAEPRAVLLFPTSHVTTALLRPYGWVFRMKREAVGLQLAINDGFGSGTIVSLTDDLQLAGVERSDQYWHVHRDLENQGRLSHAAENCPDRVAPMEVRVWTPDGGWTTQSAPLRISLSTPTGAS
jgi:hypothetical protein